MEAVIPSSRSERLADAEDKRATNSDGVLNSVLQSEGGCDDRRGEQLRPGKTCEHPHDDGCPNNCDRRRHGKSISANLNIETNDLSVKVAAMHFMVIEKFKDAPAIYKRLEHKGRMMPEGLNYVSSWIDHNLKTCWQVMETEDFVRLERWIDNWKDLMEFEIVPVRTSAEAVELMKRKL
jgi:Protein of unknown function (DUF3303)